MTGPIEYSPLTVSPFVMLLAFFLDASIGDPAWLPHPVRLIGSGINKTETFFRKIFKTSSSEKLAGVLLVIVIVGSVFAVTFFTIGTIQHQRDILALIPATIVLVYLTSTTIATRELIHSAQAVIESVKAPDIKLARESLSMIVGRDTHLLSEEGILRATIETLAENLSDGVIAPLFYLTIGGLPLAMTYKAINTLDSMVGYKNERYKDFGWAAARLDDLANYIPARITGLLISIASFIVLRSFSVFNTSLKIMFRDGRKHSSPNSGIPEAAMAGALGVRLGGPSTYGGMPVDKPYIGEDNTVDYLSASETAVILIKAASVLGICLTVILLSVRLFA